jgi:hypothetical protein
MPLQSSEIAVCELKSWRVGEKESGCQGLLGAELLARASALIDYDASLLWLFPSTEASR